MRVAVLVVLLVVAVLTVHHAGVISASDSVDQLQQRASLVERGLLDHRMTPADHAHVMRLLNAVTRWQGALFAARRSTVPNDGGDDRASARPWWPITTSADLQAICSANNDRRHQAPPTMIHPFVLTDGFGHSLLYHATVMTGVLGAGCDDDGASDDGSGMGGGFRDAATAAAAAASSIVLPAVRFGVGWQMLFLPWGTTSQRGFDSSVFDQVARRPEKSEVVFGAEAVVDSAALDLFRQMPSKFLCVRALSLIHI